MLAVRNILPTAFPAPKAFFLYLDSIYFNDLPPIGVDKNSRHQTYAIRSRAVVESYAGKVTVKVPFVLVIVPPKSRTQRAALEA